jgi:hypothetical protein
LNLFCLFPETTGSWTRSFCDNIGEFYTVVLKSSPIIIISPKCFHLNRWENSSSEEHVRNLKNQ